MPVTLTLQNTMNWAASILKNQPQMVNDQEPAVTCANIILATMVGPPMRWRFNRRTFSFPITQAGGTDYAQYLPLFGFLETQWLVDSDGAIHELNGAMSLPKVTSQGQPMQVAPQYDDNLGNITFRVKNAPNANYTVGGDFQMKPQLMTSAGSTWGVVPNEFLYIFDQGYMALIMLLVNDSRFPIFEGYFIARLLNAQQGLSEQEKNIFLQDWLRATATVAAMQGSVNLGMAARGK